MALSDGQPAEDQGQQQRDVYELCALDQYMLPDRLMKALHEYGIAKGRGDVILHCGKH